MAGDSLGRAMSSGLHLVEPLASTTDRQQPRELQHLVPVLA